MAVKVGFWKAFGWEYVEYINAPLFKIVTLIACFELGLYVLDLKRSIVISESAYAPQIKLTLFIKCHFTNINRPASTFAISVNVCELDRDRVTSPHSSQAIFKIRKTIA